MTGDELATHLRRVLDDVRVAVEDHRRMQARALELAAGLRGEGDPDVAEAGEMLAGWPGATSPSSATASTTCCPRGRRGPAGRAGTGLGILRHDRQGPHALDALPPEVGARAQDTSERLVLAKANSRSTVYRPNYLDYVSVKKLDSRGATPNPPGWPGSTGSSACTRTRPTPSPSPAFRCCGASSPRCWRPPG